MTFHVLSVAYSLATVSPAAVGGAEQVQSLLDRRLTAAGGHSVVIACDGSRVHGALRATPRPAGRLDPAARGAAVHAHREAIDDALHRWPVDVVHLHGIDFHEYLPPPGVPVLVTLHLPPDWYPPHALRTTRPDTYFHCVSESQRRACPVGMPLLPTIPNGVSLRGFRPGRRIGDYVVALGRICPEKGYHVALDAARRAAMPVLLAGRVFAYDEHARYFDDEIRPRLGDGARFVGPVAGGRKRALLAGARALLVPSLCAETSSLVAMEALACGTPVIAMRRGALPEVVEHGVTGYLVRDGHEMTEAIRAVDALDRHACRAAAVERFSNERTARAYLDTYTRLAHGTARRLAS